MTPSDDPIREHAPVDLTPVDAPVVPAKPTVAAKADALAAAREQILESLRQRHAVQPPLAWGLLVGGAALMLAIGIVLAFVLWFVSVILMGGDAAIGVRAWLIIYIVLMVPVVILVERRARGGFFSLMSTDVDLTRDNDNDADFVLRRGASHATSAINVAMFGPRAFVAGLHALRGVKERGLDLVLPEAADTLTLMLSIDGGVKIASLAESGADPLSLMPVLKWLDTHDYIGISSKGDRVWVSSPAKKRFAEEGIKVPKLEAT